MHVRPWWAPLTIVAFLGLVVCGWVAQGTWAVWVDEHPAGLLALSARLRFLVFTASEGDIGFWPWAIIGSIRLALAYGVCHLAGRVYRDDLLKIFLYIGLTPEAIEMHHRGLDKAEWIIIPWWTGSNIVAALTGIRKTPPRRLVPLLAVGIAARMALTWWVADVFEDPVKDFLDFVDDYQRWFLIGSIVLVVLVVSRNFRRGAGT